MEMGAFGINVRPVFPLGCFGALVGLTPVFFLR